MNRGTVSNAGEAHVQVKCCHEKTMGGRHTQRRNDSPPQTSGRIQSGNLTSSNRRRFYGGRRPALVRTALRGEGGKKNPGQWVSAVQFWAVPCPTTPYLGTYEYS